MFIINDDFTAMIIMFNILFLLQRGIIFEKKREWGGGVEKNINITECLWKASRYFYQSNKAGKSLLSCFLKDLTETHAKFCVC